jgi:NADH-quinone oxidoreductase subunit A
MIGLTQALLVFVGIGVFFVFIHLMLGKLIRPAKPDAEKLTIYECGEPTIGSAWIQFDLRYYVVALLFVIFDVEVVFFFPWAVVFGKANTLAQTKDAQVRAQITQELVPADLIPSVPIGSGTGQTTSLKVRSQEIDAPSARSLARVAFWDIMVFFGVLLVGFAYLWKRGDLDWVRSTAAEATAVKTPAEPQMAIPSEQREPVGAGT